VILGSNNKENITLNTDGTVEVEQISIGNIPMTSAAVTPNYEGITGQIVWNESPSLGGCVGWICLGATRWAKFGKIE
jgi:leucyl aminopeptidase (aminopeptidase T)